MQTMKSFWIEEIEQEDNHTFSIVWGDHQKQEFRLSTLQRFCPCAACQDENTGQRLVDPRSIKDDLRASHIRNVGRYGIKIQFISGCSKGIYSYTLLRSMQKG